MKEKVLKVLSYIVMGTIIISLIIDYDILFWLSVIIVIGLYVDLIINLPKTEK